MRVLLRRAWNEPYRYALGDGEDRARLRRQWHYDITRRVDEFIVADWDSGHYVLPAADRVIGQRSYLEQPYGCDVVKAVGAALGPGENPAGKTVIEIGANIGTTTIPFVSVLGAARVVAIEPSASNARILRATISLNGLHDHVSVLEIAVSDRPGRVPLAMSPVNIGDYRVEHGGSTVEPSAQGEDRFGHVEVETACLDDLLEIELSEIGLIWIDVQGLEGHVLAGAQTTLTSGAPVVCEYWPYGLRRADGLELFESQVRDRFASITDLATGAVTPAAKVESLRLEYVAADQDTNLLLRT